MRRALRLPRHRGTTAHVCSVYPFSVQPGLGHRGAFIGSDVLAGGGAFCWDPFEAYAQDLTTNPNTWVLGEPGNGKSALIKTLLYRMAGIWGPRSEASRFLAVCDPKGEYAPLAAALDLPVVRLQPGGQVRVNPLETDPRLDGAERDQRVLHQAAMAGALTATILARPLSPAEDSILFSTTEHLARYTTGATLADIARALATPPSEVAARVGRAPDHVAADAQDLVFALEKLLTRSLRGMFDGRSTVSIDWKGPGLVLDLSAVQHDAEALPLVMVAATAWLQSLMAGHRNRPKVQVLDEAWCLLGTRHTAAYLQSCWKLGRTYGVANIAIAHRASDLSAQADDGSATAKITAGLLADTATKIVLRQAPDQLDATAKMFGLTNSEQAVIGSLARGRALWRVGSNTAVVQHHVGSDEIALCDTDDAMRASSSPRERDCGDTRIHGAPKSLRVA